ncbi:MAG: PQQ-binding-like beta-propeller repeat protein [Pirellula sp.]
MFRSLKLVSGLLVALGVALQYSAKAEDSAGSWPQFRGPSNAHATGHRPPMQWSDSANIEWKVPIAGLGWSSPSIHRGVIYLTTAVPKGEGLSLRALALDAQTGKTIWDVEVKSVEKAPAIHAKNSHASPTPIVRDDAVYVHFGTLGTAKLQPGDGKTVWLCEELVYPPMHGSGGSPVLYDNKLAIICDGSTNPFVCALDASTGKVVWRTPRSVAARISHSFGTVAIAKVDGKAQVLAPGPDHLGAYDLENGQELWKIMAPGWSVVPEPILIDDMVIYNHDYDNPELMAVRLGGQGDMTDKSIVWRSARGAPSTPTPLLVDSELYYVSDNGVASCIDARSGQRHWMERLGGNYSASPVFVNGHILFLSEDGLGTWVKASKEYSLVGKNQVSGRTFATPAFYQDSMFLRTDEYLLKVSQDKK